MLLQANVFGMMATSCSRGTIDVTGSTLSPLRTPYPIEMLSGLQGSGIMSSSPNTPVSTTRRLITDSMIRSVSLLKFSLRPASCTG